MRLSVPEDGVLSPVADRYPIVVSRLRSVSEDMRNLVGNNIDVDALFNEYCRINIRDDAEYDCLGKTLFPGQQFDNVLVEAGISNLTPNEGVVFLSCSFYTCLVPSIDRYNSAVKSAVPFVYDTTPYNVLIEYTDVFHFIPTIAFPVNMRGHWGYVIVVPDGPSYSATVVWGDSLRWTPPRGLMETFRAYLVLMFRGGKFSISPKNHTLDVLGFSPQEDGYSCGFYMLAAFNKLSSAVYDEKFPMDGYRRYDSWLTERYRLSFIRTLARHILLVSAERRAITSLGLFSSMRRQFRLCLEQVSLGVPVMYPEVLPEDRICLGRENTCITREPVRDADANGREGVSSCSSGLFSEDMCPSDGAQPFIQTIPLIERLGTVTFPDLVDISTVYRVTVPTSPAVRTVPPVPRNPEVTGMRDPLFPRISEATDRPVPPSPPPISDDVTGRIDLDRPISRENAGNLLALLDYVSTESSKDESNEKEEGDTDVVTGHGAHDHTASGSVPASPAVVDSAADVIDVANPWTVEYDSPNVFAEISQRLVEGHLIRRPEYHALKTTEFKLRLRLRCRFHDPPQKWKPHAHGAVYQRCQVRMYARTNRDSGWGITFRYEHNHPIHPDSRIHGEHLRKRISVLMKSLSCHYAGTAAEYKSWLRGARSVSEPIPALRGISDTAGDAPKGSWDPDIGGEGRGESSNDDEAADDPAEYGANLPPYTTIAPRVEGAGSSVKDVEGPVSQVVPSSTGPSAHSSKTFVADEDVENVISLKHDVQETLAKYIQGCLVAIEGKWMKDELKHLSECFGFPMRVRDSEYIHDMSEPEGERGPPQVKRIFFRCPVGEDSRLRRRCHHTFTVLSGKQQRVHEK